MTVRERINGHGFLLAVLGVLITVGGVIWGASAALAAKADRAELGPKVLQINALEQSAARTAEAIEGIKRTVDRLETKVDAMRIGGHP